MSQTLLQLRTRTLDFLRETASDSHFTTDQLNGYLNYAQEFIAAIASPPEDLVSVAIEADKGRYNLASDNLVIKLALYGTTTTSNDVRKLKVVSKAVLTNIFPSWLDQTVASSGEPTHLCLYDNNTFYIQERPKSSEVGKRVYLFYGFTPTPMTADGDVPNIKANFHLLLPKLACREAYYALSNPVMAKEMFASFLTDFNSIKDIVDKESEETFAFKWSLD